MRVIRRVYLTAGLFKLVGATDQSYIRIGPTQISQGSCPNPATVSPLTATGAMPGSALLSKEDYMSQW